MSRIAAVLWSGTIGGTETFTADLCQAMHGLGATPGVVFVTHPGPLAARLDTAGIAHVSLGLGRGRDVVLHPRALAAAVEETGPDGVLLGSGGYLAAALRMGGYRGRIVVVAHDATIELGEMTLRDRLVRPLDRATGYWASDVDVAVSDFVLSHIEGRRRRGRLVRIYNGINLDTYSNGAGTADGGGAFTVAYGGRLIDGKGLDILMRSFAAGVALEGGRLRFGGDGPARPMLEDMASRLGLNEAVEFTGWVPDMPSFWRSCDVAVTASNECVESFGMSTLEAMACGRPVVVTANGALPELVDDGVTGIVVPRGSSEALSDALVSLAGDPDRRQAAGHAARARCEQHFDIRDCASAYLDLLQSLEAER
jgi:glycosyltransferase involved in cell wall biosynthesis